MPKTASLISGTSLMTRALMKVRFGCVSDAAIIFAFNFALSFALLMRAVVRAKKSPALGFWDFVLRFFVFKRPFPRTIEINSAGCCCYQESSRI